MKRTILILILTVFIGLKPTACQPTPLDTVHRKVWISGMAGANSFFKSPAIGLLSEIEITDNKHPLIIHFNAGCLIIPSMAKRMGGMAPNSPKMPQSVIASQLDFGRSFKKIDLLVSPIGFVGSPGWDFIPQMSVSLYYKGVKITNKDKLQFRISANYSFSKVPQWGAVAMINYRFKQFKKL